MCDLPRIVGYYAHNARCCFLARHQSLPLRSQPVLLDPVLCFWLTTRTSRVNYQVSERLTLLTDAYVRYISIKMVTINDLPPEIIRMIFKLLDQQPPGQEKITRIIPRVLADKSTVRWLVRCEMASCSDHIDISIFEAMQVCYAWQRTILDLLSGSAPIMRSDENGAGCLKRIRSFEVHYRARHELWVFDR